jgi:hypothetical protein
MPNKAVLFILLLFLSLPKHSNAEENGHKMSSVDCNFDIGTCTRILEDTGFEITLDINPKPVTAMSELLFSVIILKNGLPVTKAEAVVDLTMPGMYMGKNQVFLKSKKDNKYEGTGVIPFCSSGSKRWMAEIKATLDDKVYSAAYTFDVR